ncbi:MAG TPA: hypothetical protein VK735_39830 [Pseudonocardia sp.]|uniref:hypothetical protein n=1 Tax=Pseudonocardia sp. TaxID=60912 RepID=UPI002C90EAD7|nr:hypothetical protein [Pseudonocardia sp.]HTF53634.1 hypothetical protein [Pseudonocardia sp.]
MALRVTIADTASTLADYEIKRVTNVNGLVGVDDNNHYEIREITPRNTVGPLIDTVEHRYGDGKERLAIKALLAVEAANAVG